MNDTATQPIVTPALPKGPRKAAIAFIFATALMDVISLGIMIPVLPNLVKQYRELGVASFCLGLDSAAESSLRCIFGNGNYVLTDRPNALEQLPESLGRLYLRLAR